MLELVSTAVPTAPTGRSRTRLRRGEQFSAAHKQVHQGTGNEQPVRVLLQPAIAYFHESELQLHYLKHVLHPRPHLRLRPVLCPRHFIYDLALVATAPLGEIPRSLARTRGSPRFGPDTLRRPTPAFLRHAAGPATPPTSETLAAVATAV